MVANAVNDYRRGKKYGVIKDGMVVTEAFGRGWNLTRNETFELINFLFGSGLLFVVQHANLRISVNAVLATLEPEVWREIRERVRRRKQSETKRLRDSLSLQKLSSIRAKQLTVGASSTGTLSERLKTKRLTSGCTSAR
jgi:hypothetical protein